MSHHFQVDLRHFTQTRPKKKSALHECLNDPEIICLGNFRLHLEHCFPHPQITSSFLVLYRNSKHVNVFHSNEHYIEIFDPLNF